MPQKNPVSSYLPAPAGPVDSSSDDSFTGPVNPQFMPQTNVKGNAKDKDNSKEMDDLKDNQDSDDGMKDGPSPTDIILDSPPPPDHEHHHDHHHHHDDHPEIIFDHEHDFHDHHHPHPPFLDHPPSHDDIFSSVSGPDHDHDYGSHGVDASPGNFH